VLDLAVVRQIVVPYNKRIVFCFAGTLGFGTVD
jgi:hypothetical protein